MMHGTMSLKFYKNLLHKEIGLKLKQETNELIFLGYFFIWCWNLERFGKYSVIKNDCRGFNNLLYTIHLR